jgi:uncharacterized protein
MSARQMIRRMTEPQAVISLGAAFVAGVLGSVHCFAMCGALAGALGLRARQVGATPQRTFCLALSSQLGRIASYVFIGAAVGGAGAWLTTVMSWVHAAATLRVLAGAVLLAMAIRVAFNINFFAGLERVGARLWSKLGANRLALTGGGRQPGLAQSLLMGLAWGWLPCGLVYSMALYAALSGSVLQGALIMLAFGAGTLPSMLSSSVMAAQLARIVNARHLRLGAALLLAALGAWTIYAALAHGAHH